MRTAVTLIAFLIPTSVVAQFADLENLTEVEDEHAWFGDIHVPPMFFKIVVLEDPDPDVPVHLAFLFPHQRVRLGEIEDFLVTVDVIEALTGLDFLSGMDEGVEQVLEDRDTFENWVGFW